jgi:hypothetical protein
VTVFFREVTFDILSFRIALTPEKKLVNNDRVAIPNPFDFAQESAALGAATSL